MQRFEMFASVFDRRDIEVILIDKKHVDQKTLTPIAGRRLEILGVGGMLHPAGGYQLRQRLRALYGAVAQRYQTGQGRYLQTAANIRLHCRSVTCYT